MDAAHIFSVIESLNEEYCDLWEKVCNMESPTDYKKGVDGGRIHSPQEFAYLESLGDCARRLTAMAMHL